MSTKLNAWKAFLEGRIHEEKKEFTEALALYEKALAIDAGNPHFLRSKGNATAGLASLNDSQKSEVDELKRRYDVLAKKYVGENDKPELWIKELDALLNSATESNKAFKAEAIGMAVAW